MGDVIDLDDHRAIWMNVRERCTSCGKECVGTVPQGCDLDALECGGCGLMTSRATHVLCEDEVGQRWWRLSVVGGTAR